MNPSRFIAAADEVGAALDVVDVRRHASLGARPVNRARTIDVSALTGVLGCERRSGVQVGGTADAIGEAGEESYRMTGTHDDTAAERGIRRSEQDPTDTAIRTNS